MVAIDNVARVASIEANLLAIREQILELSGTDLPLDQFSSRLSTLIDEMTALNHRLGDLQSAN